MGEVQDWLPMDYLSSSSIKLCGYLKIIEKEFTKSPGLFNIWAYIYRVIVNELFNRVIGERLFE